MSIMKKSDVYKLIGYNGEYNTNVKKAIRKLLKENHPDNKGNRETFELINEIKKELESGKIPTIKKEVSKNNDLDYEYYYKIINNLKTKKNNLMDQINDKKNILNKYEEEYKTLYQKSLDLENSLVNTTTKTNDIKVLSIALVIIMIIVILVAILTNNDILFVVLIILAIIGVLAVQKRVLLVHKVNEKNKKGITNYVKINNEIKENIKKRSLIKKDISDLKNKLTNVENDLRFYKNLLK